MPQHSDDVNCENAQRDDKTTSDTEPVEAATCSNDVTCKASPSSEETVSNRIFATSQKSAFAKVNPVAGDPRVVSRDNITTNARGMPRDYGAASPDCVTAKSDPIRRQTNVFPMPRQGFQRPTLLPPTLRRTDHFSNKHYQEDYFGIDHVDMGRRLASDVAKMAAIGGNSLANLQLMTYCDPRLPITNYWLYLSKLFATSSLPAIGTGQVPDSRVMYPSVSAGVFVGSTTMTSHVHHVNTDHHRTDNSVVFPTRQQSFDVSNADHHESTSLPFTPDKHDIIETEVRPSPEMCSALGSSSSVSPITHFHVAGRDFDAPPAKKYKCDLCGKAFSRSNTLVTHRVSSVILPSLFFILKLNQHNIIYNYIQLTKSRDCLFPLSFGSASLPYYAMQINAFVNTMKVYIERNNLQLE